MPHDYTCLDSASEGGIRGTMTLPEIHFQIPALQNNSSCTRELLWLPSPM